ncbi:MAG TPA: hypothetical protein VLG36_04400 [Candidatus Chromulinivoraceae bacterium]|nr:hypothetical protein [Candidatus Chromulinivoraceae bacterium]
MDITTSDDGSVNLTNSLDLATWNRPRTSEELRSFIASHADRLPDDIDVE